MKHTICIPIFGIVLAMFACVATAYEICKEFATYYTYCDDDYYCCLADSSCCYSSSGGIFGGSGSFPTTSSYVLSGGAIAGIVLGCTLFMVGLTICIKAMKGNSKTGQGRSVIGPVRVAPVGGQGHKNYLLGNKGSHIYNGNTDWTCKLCHKGFSSEKTLKKHKCTYCPRCETCFSSFQRYTGHKCFKKRSKKSCASMLSAVNYTFSQAEPQKIKDKENFVCSFCSRLFKSEKTLKSHNCSYCKNCKKCLSSFQRLKEHKCIAGEPGKENMCKDTDSVKTDNSSKAYPLTVVNIQNSENTGILGSNTITPIVSEGISSRPSTSVLVGEEGTMIPDDVVEVAMSIMRRHSPELAPYIGMLTPAQLHLITNSNELAVVPQIPNDKISINIHLLDAHWLTSVFRPMMNCVTVYDSLRSDSRIRRLKSQLNILYGNKIQIRYPLVTQQKTDPLCGALAIAFAFSTLLGIPPETQPFDVSLVRSHLKHVLDTNSVSPFPVTVENERLSSYFTAQAKLQQTKAPFENNGTETKSLMFTSDSDSRSSKRKRYMQMYMSKRRKYLTEDSKRMQREKERLQKQKQRKYKAEHETLTYSEIERKRKAAQRRYRSENKKIEDNMKNRYRMIANRKSRPENKKIEDNMKDRNRKEENRKSRPENKKMEDNMKNRYRMIANRKSRPENKKIEDNMKDRNRKGENRKSRPENKKMEDNMKNRNRMKANRKSRPENKKVEDIMKDRYRKTENRKNRSENKKIEDNMIDRNRMKANRKFRSASEIIEDNFKDRYRKEENRKFRSASEIIEDSAKDRSRKRGKRRTLSEVQKAESNEKNRKRMAEKRSHRSEKEKVNYRVKDRISKSILRNFQDAETKYRQRVKDKERKADIRKHQSMLIRGVQKLKAWLRMQTLRLHRNDTKKLQCKMKDKHRKRMLRNHQSVLIQIRERLKAKEGMRNLRLNVDQLKKQKDRARKKIRRQNLTDAQKNKQNVADRKRKNAAKNCSAFQQLSQHGPEYVCTVCNRLLYKQSTTVINSHLLSKLSDDLVKTCLSDISSRYICCTCLRHLRLKKLPPMAMANKMEIYPLPDELANFSQLEARLVAQRIPFMKILNLPKGKQKAIIGSVVNVPVDVSETVAALPRTATSSGFIPLKLKRKQSYSGHVLYQMVRPEKVESALQYLKHHNEHYKNVTVNENWQEHFRTEDSELWDALVQAPDDNQHENSNFPDAETNEENNPYDRSAKGQESLRGIEFDTCVQSDDLANILGNEEFSIAPGEGRLPLQVYNDPNNEVLTFPALYPTGKYGFDVSRPRKLTLRKYFQARLTCSDNRFAADPEYLFYAQYLTEHKQVSDSINIALRKAKLPNDEDKKVNAGIVKNVDRLKSLIVQDHGQRFLQNVRGSPAYCRKILSDLLAMIRQLGPFTFFLTLSAADLRWPETICVIASQFNVSLSEKDVIDMPWEERCNWLRRNPVTAARQFDYRVQLFVKHVLGSGVIGPVKDYLYRVEFQQRGSPHIHMVIWIQEAPEFLTATDKEITDFVNKHIYCSLPSDDEDLREKVNKLQRHVHSHSCRKSGKKCRFAFPKAPAKETIVCRGDKGSTEQDETSKQVDGRLILNSVFETLENMELSEATTVDDVLQSAGVQEEIYLEALRHSKSSSGIILQRRVCEQFINNYNPEILKVWNANMDIQYVSDPYGCVMYVSSYITKPEHEMSETLELTSKQASETDIRRHLQKIASKFLTSREVSAQEAAYRVLSLPLSRSTRQVVYIPTDLPEDRFHLLKPISVIETMEDDDEDIYQVGMVERYMKRPNVLEDLSLAEFVSSYSVDYQKNKNETSDTQLDVLQPDLKSKKSLRLQDGIGYVKERNNPAIIRTFKYSVKKQPEKYYHSLLMLYYPWRTEQSLCRYGDGTFQSMYEEVIDVVQQNLAKFEKHSDVVDTAIQDLEEFGPPEDAWAQLAAETEHEKQKERQEGSHPAEEYMYTDPDQHPEASHAAAGGISLLQKVQAWIMEDDDYCKLIQTLNNKQRQVFSEVYGWCFRVITSKRSGKLPSPFLTFISGSAGTGKSHLIKALYQAAVKTLRCEADTPDDIVCLLTAPTGTAAYNIHGQTLHSAFSLSHSSFDRTVSQAKLSSLRAKYSNLFLLIIDEISMVGSDLLHVLHKRLTEIKGAPNALFGGVSVLAFGDLYQLPPVGQSAVFSLPKDPMKRLYGTVWDDFTGFELTEIMRQQDDRSFAELLTRIRTKSHKEEDVKLLASRMITHSDNSYPSEALHIFSTNALVNKHNRKKIDELPTPIFHLEAEDKNKEIQTGQFSLTIPNDPNLTGGLAQSIELAVGARVMITKNVDTTDGVVNGMMGTVLGFYPQPGCTLQSSGTDKSSFKPSFVLVQLDDPEAGQAARKKFHTVLGNYPMATPVSKEEVRFRVGKYKVAEVSRRQFPLKLSWASTIHKVQGLTLPKVVVSCEGFFGPGQFYVAVSRVKSLSCLYFTSFDADKIKENSKAAEALHSMMIERPLSPTPLWKGDTATLCICSLNINSLVPHLKDLQNHHILLSSDIVALTETWLRPSRLYNLHIENFKWERADRASCFTEQQLALQTATFQSHGGVLNYIRNGLDMIASSHSVKGIEYICLTVRNCVGGHGILNLITVYRPPSQTLEDFLNCFKEVVDTEVDINAPTIICGDFNVDALTARNQQLRQFFLEKKFVQLVPEATHIQGSCLDHIYSNVHTSVDVRVIPVTFSPHAAVQILCSF